MTVNLKVKLSLGQLDLSVSGKKWLAKLLSGKHEHSSLTTHCPAFALCVCVFMSMCPSVCPSVRLCIRVRVYVRSVGAMCLHGSRRGLERPLI